MIEKIKNYLMKIYRITQMKEMKILPGHLAYFMVLTIMPIVSLITLVFGVFNVSLGDMFGFLFDFMPEKVSEIILPVLDNSNTSFSIIFIIVGFVISSKGAHSVILTSNELYGFKNRGYLARHLKAILMTIMLILIILISLLGIAFGSNILNVILSMDIFSNISVDILNLFDLLKYPLSFILIYYIVRSIYSMAPDTKINSRKVIPGALFTTSCWLVVNRILLLLCK